MDSSAAYKFDSKKRTAGHVVYECPVYSASHGTLDLADIGRESVHWLLGGGSQCEIEITLSLVMTLVMIPGKDSPLDGDESTDICVTGGRPEPSPHCCLPNQLKSKKH